VIAWGIGGFFTFLVIILQGAACDYTVYGDSRVSSQYNYYADSPEFRSYVDTYTADAWAAHGSLSEPVPSFVNQRLAESGWPSRVPAAVDWEQYMQPYTTVDEVGDAHVHAITPCFFNWTALLAAQKFFGADPCTYVFEDSDAVACIGAWSAKQFQAYWCWAYTTGPAEQLEWENAADRTEADRQKRSQAKEVSWEAVDSIGAFYRHNTILLGLTVVSFIVTTVSLVIEFVLIKKEVPNAGVKKETELPDQG
jgi:hypothetical protein